jgi:hypothetical protein
MVQALILAQRRVKIHLQFIAFWVVAVAGRSETERVK